MSVQTSQDSNIREQLFSIDHAVNDKNNCNNWCLVSEKKNDPQDEVTKLAMQRLTGSDKSSCHKN